VLAVWLSTVAIVCTVVAEFREIGPEYTNDEALVAVPSLV
jgi:hypothetical protein